MRSKIISTVIFSFVFSTLVFAEQTAKPIQELTPILKAAQQMEPMPELPKGPLLLTSTTSEQLTADYWVKRLKNADQVLKTPNELKKFNEEIDDQLPEVMDVFKIKGMFRGTDVQSNIQEAYDTVANRKLFDVRNKVVPKSFFENEVKPFLNLENIPKMVKIRWGTAIKATSVRALPTYVKVLEEVGDVEFDQLQFTLIKLWTPVAIYQESSDGRWYFIQAPYVRGWVESKDVAIFKNQDELKKYAKSKSFLDVTGESVRVCSDISCKNMIERPTMGTVIPRAGKLENNYVVYMPKRGENGNVILKKAFINRHADVLEHFPPYTQANFIRQAFKLLGVRYGWGGMYNGRDCSGFTHDVFLSMGVAMPRDSKQQPFVGTQLGHFEPYQDRDKKIAALDVATEGISLLRMPHHIMLYIGSVDGKYFVIHSTWAERIGQDKIKDEKRRINQVVVSDLSLNGKSYLGDLFERVIGINEVN